MLQRRLLMGGGGSFPTPEEDVVRGTSVKRTSNHSTAATNAVVDFDTQEYDDDNLWVIGDPSKIGPVPSGYNGKRAVLYATAIWDSAAAGYRELKIFRNGDDTEPVAVVQVAVATGNTGVELTSRPIILATGDYFELCARSQNASTAQYAEDYSLTFSLEVRMS